MPQVLTETRESAIETGLARGNLSFILMIVAALVLLALQVYHFFPFIADDAFISLRYSQRLLEGKGLTWSDGQRVEGYTNLLWVLACAGLGKLGLDLVLAARLLGCVCTLTAFAALVAYLREAFAPPRRTLAGVCSLVPFSLSSSVAVWMLGGLEQTLLIALLGWALVSVHRFLASGRQRSLLTASALLAGVTLTRADGLLYPLLIALGLVIANARRSHAIRTALLVLVGPTIAYLGQLGFRLAYYHEWLPNTAYVKVSFTLHRLVTGIVYLVTANLAELSLVLLALLGVVALWRNANGRAHAILYLVVVGGASAYLVLVGGDIFPAIRLFLPVILVLCFVAAHASTGAYAPTDRLRKARVAFLAAVALLTFASRLQAARAVEERWEFQNRELGLYLQQHLPPNELIVADAAGAIPFYSGLQALDPLGLNDHHIAHMASSTRGQGFLGHELGDGKYILDHHPDVIVFGPSGVATPLFPSDRQIASDPRFAAEYQLERWSFTRPMPWVSEVYVRRPQSRPATAHPADQPGEGPVVIEAGSR